MSNGRSGAWGKMEDRGFLKPKPSTNTGITDAEGNPIGQNLSSDQMQDIQSLTTEAFLSGKDPAEVIKAKYGDINLANQFSPPDLYDVPDETKQIYESSQEAAGLIREQAGEMVDIAEAERGMIQAPGQAEAERARGESTASAVASATEVGGASTSALGALEQIEAGNISSMRDASIQTQMFRDQADKEYRQALMDRSGAEVAAVQTEAQGMQEMLRARETQYQVNYLDPFYAQQQYDIQMATAEMAKKPTFGEQVKSLFKRG